MTKSLRDKVSDLIEQVFHSKDDYVIDETTNKIMRLIKSEVKKAEAQHQKDLHYICTGENK
jgi:hypothetical protein